MDRCRLLVHIVDVSGSEGRDPIEDFNIINCELEKFDADLATRPMIVVGNKCDLAEEEQIAEFREYVEGRGYEFFPIMAAIRYDVDPLLNCIHEKLSKLPPIRRYEPEAAPQKPVEDFTHREVKITNQDGVYMVEGDWLLPVLNSINFNDYESMQYFQRVLIQCGVIDALRQAGIEEGDTVSIYNVEFDFVE